MHLRALKFQNFLGGGRGMPPDPPRLSCCGLITLQVLPTGLTVVHDYMGFVYPTHIYTDHKDKIIFMGVHITMWLALQKQGMWAHKIWLFNMAYRGMAIWESITVIVLQFKHSFYICICMYFCLVMYIINLCTHKTCILLCVHWNGTM